MAGLKVNKVENNLYHFTNLYDSLIAGIISDDMRYLNSFNFT